MADCQPNAYPLFGAKFMGKKKTSHR